MTAHVRDLLDGDRGFTWSAGNASTKARWNAAIAVDGLVMRVAS